MPPGHGSPILIGYNGRNGEGAEGGTTDVEHRDANRARPTIAHSRGLGEEFGPEHEVELIRCPEGILVKPLPKTPVQAALERKLPMQRPSQLDLADIDMDALGW